VTIPVVRFTVAGQDTPRHGLGRPYTVVYDGDCTVCTRLANALRPWDRGQQLEVVSSQQPGVMARFPWIPPRAYAEALQLIADDGTTSQGAAAVEQLLNVLPRGPLISWIFKVPFVRTLADRFYRWFARNRYRLGCGSHCQSRPLDVIWAEAEREG
jgi:predicted DCC family thiol-disulfide oxidoreductase YuxK